MLEKKSEMMTIEEIQNCKNINVYIIKEALRQAEERLNDVLDTRKQFEQKAFILFSGYLTGSMGLFIIAVTLFFDEANKHNLFMSFIISGIILLAGAILILYIYKNILTN